MTKDEFLRLLDRKLDVINERERRDIIDEYRTHIEMKMKEGKSEEEAIEDFGNIDDWWMIFWMPIKSIRIVSTAPSIPS